MQKNNFEKYTFIILGNTAFNGPPQREHAFAVEIAKKGFSVIYIEGMPSFGRKTKDYLYSIIFNQKEDLLEEKYPSLLKVFTPPTLPTFFRSSYTPSLDILIFSSWFNKITRGISWETTITIATFPYWWIGFFNRKKYPTKLLVYDKCDSLSVASRNKRTLKKMVKAENCLISETDLITYSAYSLESEFSKYSQIESLCIPNAISTEFYNQAQKYIYNNGTKIGFVGTFDDRWIDLVLIEKILQNIPDHKFIFVAPFRRKFNRVIEKYSNAELTGFINPQKIPQVISEFKVAIIPFLQNTITNVVNPLKLYEYCALGIPIIAMRTVELEKYSDVVHLADSHNHFIDLIKNLSKNENKEEKEYCIDLAHKSLWEERVYILLDKVVKKIESL